MEYIKIMKGDTVHIGALYLFEGELMKITIKEPESFAAGDLLNCEYKQQRFSTKILKKKDYQIYILVPQFNKNFPNDKREHPRLKVNLEGEVFLKSADKQFEITIIDISRRGIGFLADEKLPFEETYKVKADTPDLKVKGSIKLRNESEQDQQFRYGSEIVDISENDLFLLRKFILATQLKTNMAK